MNATLALTLAPEGITLLARAAAGTGWVVLEQVDFTDPQMAARLGDLRKTAKEIGGPDFTTLLVLPNDQLLYTTLPLRGEDPMDAALRVLDGATPYAVSELAFDISLANAPEPAIHVAAVALETLAEAEEFARAQGLRPLAFTAVPELGYFSGAPNFGMTGGGEALLNGAQFDPESDVITLVEGAPLRFAPEPEPEPEPAPEPEPEPELALEDPEEPETSPEPKPSIGFASRRQGEAKSPSPEALAAAARLGQVAPRFGVPNPAPAPAEATSSGGSALSAPKRGSEAKPDATAPAPKRSARPALLPPALLATALAAAKSLGTKARALKKTKTKVASKALPEASPQTEPAAPSLALPGLPREPRPARLGLWLTLVLLILLLLLGLWSLLVLPPGSVAALFGREAAPRAVATLPTRDAPDALEALDAGRLLPDQADALELAPDPGQETALASALLTPETAPISDPSQGALALLEDGEAAAPTIDPNAIALPQLTVSEALALYSGQGVWVLTPSAPVPALPDEIAGLYVTGLDIAPKAGDPIALPNPSALAADLSLERPALPPPPGTTYALDERGLVAATPEGSYAPNGALVFAGRPAVDLVPAQRPEDRVAAPADAQSALRAELARLRPTPRPADFAEQMERALNDGVTQQELARLRPRPRPQSQQDAAAEAARLAQGASLAGAPREAAALQEAPDAVQSDSRLAVAASDKPAARPSNFAQIVAEARARGAVAAPQEPAAVATAAAVVRPSIPSSASVAQAATTRNALVMNRTALLGVFGKPSNRGALVRLRGGRTTRVEVGDRLDGGQVVAIDAGRVIYRKGGRDLTLEMPKI